MRLELAAEIRLYQRQNGAQFENTLAINERGMSVKLIVTEGTRTDCKETINLLKNLDAKLVFADRVYDTNEIFSCVAKFVASLCTCDSFKFFSYRHYLIKNFLIRKQNFF